MYLYGREKHLVERKEDGDLDQDWQTSPQGVDLLPPVQFDHFLLLPELVIGPARANRRNLRLHLPHLRC
jgi:hypothetical protein